MIQSNILFNQLAGAVINKITDRYSEASVYEITQYNCGEEIFYSMIVETDSKKLKIKALSSGDLAILEKLRK